MLPAKATDGTNSRSRLRLLVAARELLWRNSYATVSVDDLCRRAEVHKGSFYHHFPSKAELAVAAFEAGWTELRPHLDEMFSVQVPPLERFERYLVAIGEVQAQKQREQGCVLGCPYTALGSEIGTQDESLRRISSLTSERTCAYFAAAIRDGQLRGEIPAGDPAMLAAQVQAFITGTATQARIANDLSLFTHLAAGVRRLLGIS